MPTATPSPRSQAPIRWGRGWAPRVVPLPGAAVGTAVAGPVGHLVGGVAGAIAGGLGGHAAGRSREHTVRSLLARELQDASVLRRPCV